MIKILIGSLIMTVVLSGCTMMGLGESEGFCESHGADYSDAGVCWHPWDVYHNREAAKKAAYKDVGACDD